MAVIAVHGVADHEPGETARSLADLLVVAGPRTAPDGPRYTLTGSEALGLRVPTLAPSPQAQADWTGGARTHELPVGQRLAKAWRQSMASDLHRAPVRQPASGAAADDAPALQQPDIELTDFLLAQSLRNQMPDAVFDTQRLTLQRQGGGAQSQSQALARTETVHVYEMYWSDLSRLAGNLPRILTELFTLISRLSQLGRDTVAAATRQYRADNQPSSVWESLDMTQAALDWLFSRVLAQLMLNLFMVVLVIAPLGWLAGRDMAQDRLQFAVALGAPAALWLVWFYRTAPGRLASWLAGALAVAVAWGLLTNGLLLICDARFPMTRAAGGAIAVASLSTVLLTGAGLFPADLALLAVRDAPADGLLLFVVGGLRAMELLLLGTLLSWLVLAPVMLTWFFLGWRCVGTRGYAGDATVATGRLGLFVSMAFFMTLVMATWALLHPLLMLSVGDLLYEPFFFTETQFVTPRTAGSFLTIRYHNTTETFSLLAVLLFLVVLYLLVGLLPSLLAEVNLLPDQPQPLGRWLTRTLRYLDLMIKLLVAAAVMVVALVALDLWFAHWKDYPVPELRDLGARVRDWSQNTLSPLTLAVTAASGTAVMTALGGLLSRYVPGLRAPLDVALDVDNHFREFPRKGIPRSRIFSRFAALLRHVHDQGYDHIVIVAHSQGTVITAELLRYLHVRAAQLGDTGPAAVLGRALAGRVQLLTAGCPLRQLYASRFPTLYPWVLGRQLVPDALLPLLPPPLLVGPGAADIGVQRWVNVYTTGDYVGRWLWSRPPDPQRDRSATILDDNGTASGVYTATDSAAAVLQRLAQPLQQFDVCLGCGAHTHYFASDQLLVAALVDGLVDRQRNGWAAVPQPEAA